MGKAAFGYRWIRKKGQIRETDLWVCKTQECGIPEGLRESIQTVPLDQMPDGLGLPHSGPNCFIGVCGIAVNLPCYGIAHLFFHLAGKNLHG